MKCCFKENEEDEDIRMAAVGFIFLASKISKEKAFWGDANIKFTKKNYLTHLFRTPNASS